MLTRSILGFDFLILIYVFHSVVKNPTSAFQYLHWPHFSFFLPLLLLVLHQKPAKNALRSKSNKPGKTTIIQIQKNQTHYLRTSEVLDEVPGKFGDFVLMGTR